MEVGLFAVVALLLLAALLWLVREPAAPALPVSRRTAEAEKLQFEELFPLHCRHFPQIQQALSRGDAEFVEQRVGPEELRRWRRERRAVVRRFVAGLAEDYAKLARLARTVALLAPEVSRRRESELFWLGVRFRVLYALVRLRLALGAVPAGELERLADLMGGLARQMEAAIASLGEGSLRQVQSRFTA
jgi:hypothetical protein